MPLKIKAFLLRHEYLIWILCACAILRLPSLLEPYWYGDEGIYLTLGNAIRHGLTLYKDIHDNKPPVIYFMAALTGSVFWFRFFLLAWNSVAIVAFERLAHLLLDDADHPGFTSIGGIQFPRVTYSTIATVLFAIIPFFAEGAIANGEIFMVMPAIVGMYLLWRQMTNDKWQMKNIVLSGFFFSLAFLIKVPSLFDAFAAGFFFLIVVPFTVWRVQKRDFHLGSYLLPLISFSMAFLLPILLSFAYYSAKGVGKEYVSAAFAQNIGYLSSWATGTHAASNVGSSGLKNRAVGFGIAMIALLLLSKKNGNKLTFLAMWFAATLFGAFLAERPYPHYLIQVIPPASLLVVFLGQSLLQHSKGVRLLPILTAVTALVIGIYGIWAIKFWYYPLMPYYQNYISFVTRRQTKDRYYAHFDPNLPAMYATSERIAAQTTPDDRIFVWGDYPMIYALSRRLPPGKYTSSYHIQDFNGFDVTTEALEKMKPKYIVIDTNYKTPYPGLAAYMTGQYVQVASIAPFVTYRKIDLH